MQTREAAARGESPVAMECKVTNILQLEDRNGAKIDYHVVFGEVVGVHIDPSFINSEGKVQITEMKPIARCGYLADYTVLDDLFQMERPA